MLPLCTTTLKLFIITTYPKAPVSLVRGVFYYYIRGKVSEPTIQVSEMILSVHARTVRHII